MPNRLINATSPYLLQHAHNPVDWYPWSKEALERAKEENKPILISIGYAACHWCHVMERESFEDEKVAEFMNEHFINIKVDREERPDLDQIYMDAITAMTGQGGWPLNCFLTPDGRPFYGGTYFPPQPMYGKPNWLYVLKRIAETFKTQRQTIEEQANNLTYHIQSQDQVIFKNPIFDDTATYPVDAELVVKVFNRLQTSFDTDDGGFGGAPKFPGTMNIDFLMQYYHHSQEQLALDHALFSIDKMIEGGIYDQIGGGFARYTVDKEWLVPHFEKMLYDNALLVGIIADAYKITQNPDYLEVIQQTLSFIETEMRSEEGGFYASYDADSEGVEGKYYVWDKAEVDRLIGNGSVIFDAFFDITEEGNWEGKNILNRRMSYAQFAEKTGLEMWELKQIVAKGRKALLEERQKRVKPGLDDKIILSWNAMMCVAYAKAYEASGNPHYLDIAVQNMDFLLVAFQEEGGKYFHTYKNGIAKYPAFLSDYAQLIDALIVLYQVSHKVDYLKKAAALTKHVRQHFSDTQQVGFYFTPDYQEDTIIRKKEFYDGATPSGNSMMAYNLFRLAALLGKWEYRTLALKLLKSVETMIMKAPSSFGRWATTWMNFAYPFYEVAVVGKEAVDKMAGFQKKYYPNKVTAIATDAVNYPELVENRFIEGKTLIYICKDQACEQPVEEWQEVNFV